MKKRAKTYQQFLNETYVDSDGNLRDLEFTDSERAKLEMLDELNTISDFLERSGASKVSLDLDFEDVGVYILNFTFEGNRYGLHIDTDSEKYRSGEVTVVQLGIGRGHHQIEVVRMEANSFFDLLSSAGLDFLSY